MAENINDSDFEDKVLKADKPVLVDFWAEWCAPCRILGPRIEELSGEMDEVDFVKVNVDENQETAGKYGVRSIPTMILFKDGEIKGQMIGALPKDSIKEKIQELLS